MAAADRSKAPARALTTRADGHQLAVDMLLEMRSIGADEMTIDKADERRAGRAQSDVLQRYMCKARANPALEAGFVAVLTDFIGSSLDGGVPDPEFYERPSGNG